MLTAGARMRNANMSAGGGEAGAAAVACAPAGRTTRLRGGGAADTSTASKLSAHRRSRSASRYSAGEQADGTVTQHREFDVRKVIEEFKKPLDDTHSLIDNFATTSSDLLGAQVDAMRVSAAATALDAARALRFCHLL